MRWLVTGGCGFIGKSLVSKLLNAGEQVRIVDNLSATGRPLDLPAVKTIETSNLPYDGPACLLIGDIRDPALAAAAAAGVDVIVHLAACTGVMPSIENPRFDCETNVLGTLNYLEAARKENVKAFILASSGAPLGDQQPPIHEDMVPRPLSPYGASKLAGEAYCSAFHGSFGLRTIALRFSNVYGPHCMHKESVIARFIRKALKGKPLEIFGDGSQTRDFVHVEDLVNAILLSAEKGQGGQVYQIATQLETPTSFLAETIRKEMKELYSRHVEIKFLPSRKGEVIRSYADIRKARTELGWSPQWSLEKGIRELILWYSRQA